MSRESFFTGDLLSVIPHLSYRRYILITLDRWFILKLSSWQVEYGHWSHSFRVFWHRSALLLPRWGKLYQIPLLRFSSAGVGKSRETQSNVLKEFGSRNLVLEIYVLEVNNERDSVSFVRLKWIPWLKMIIWVNGVLRRTVFGDWRFDNLCGSHLQSLVIDFSHWSYLPMATLSIDRSHHPIRLLKVQPTKIDHLHRLSERQSPRTVLLRTPFTQMIIFNQGMLLLSSNHLLTKTNGT